MGLSMGFEALLRTEFPSLSFTLLQSSDPLPSRKSRGPLVVVCGGPLVPSSPNPPYPPDFGSVGVVSSPLMFSRGSASTPLKLYEVFELCKNFKHLKDEFNIFLQCPVAGCCWDLILFQSKLSENSQASLPLMLQETLTL